MAVLIKGMEMPQSCTECKFWTITSCTATFQGEKSCPLIEIQEPHGRLIDADALIKDHPRKWTAYDLQRIANAPTIIPTVIPASEEG